MFRRRRFARQRSISYWQRIITASGNAPRTANRFRYTFLEIYTKTAARIGENSHCGYWGICEIGNGFKIYIRSQKTNSTLSNISNYSQQFQLVNISDTKMVW